MRMQDKVVIVTGAALGYKAGGPSIGSAIAFALAREGATVVAVDKREDMGQAVIDRIHLDGGSGLFLKTDVSRTADVMRVITTVRNEYGRLHCLVNCAASYEGDIFHNVVDTPEDDWAHILDVNLNGYFRFAKYAVPLILESGGGTVVNISSCAAFRAAKDFSVYPVTKAAINALTRTLAVDFAPHLRANAIAPGFVRIANSENDRTEKELDAWLTNIAKGYPLKRVCTVDEVARVATFLASDDSSYVTGQCLEVDGGSSIFDQHEY